MITKDKEPSILIPRTITCSDVPCSRETFSAFFPLSRPSSGASPPGFCNILCGPNHIAHAYYILICLYVYYCILHAYLSVFVSIGMSKGTKWVSVFVFFKIYLFNLFIFGWVGSSLLPVGPLQLRRVGATPPCGAPASHCGGLSCCGARALGMWASVTVARGLSSCGSQALERRLSSCGARA